MPLRAISFDLFDTLVDLRVDALPEFELAGRRLRGSQPLLFEALAPHCALDFTGFARTLAEVDRELRDARHAQGLETPTLERFETLCRRLEIADGELPERLTQIHMGCIRGQVVVLDHHPAVLAALRKGKRFGARSEPEASVVSRRLGARSEPEASVVSRRFGARSEPEASAVGLKLAVCSNFSHAPTARRVLAEARLLDSFDAVLISEEVGIRKPRREIFAAVLDALGCAAADVLHVGDQLESDVGGAAELGLRTAWITRRVPDVAAARARYAGPLPDHVLADLAELPRLRDVGA